MEGHIAGKTVSVCLVDKLCEGQQQQTHSVSLGTLFCVDLGFDACVGVVGFACLTS